MAGMGPPPKPAGERRRRNATIAMTALPAEGRQGEPPEWPLNAPSERELDLWAELWATPQAVMWERMRAAHTVARYVRFSVMAERGHLPAATEARQIEDRLGLNPMALLRLRWEVVEDQVAEQRVSKSKHPASARSRLRVVDPEAAHGAVAGS